MNQNINQDDTFSKTSMLVSPLLLCTAFTSVQGIFFLNVPLVGGGGMLVYSVEGSGVASDSGG